MSTDTTTDFHLDRPVTAPVALLQAAIARPEAWWTTVAERNDDEMTVHFAHNWTRLRIAGERWTVTAQDTPDLPVADEWVGSALTFRAEDAGDGTSVLRFTHHGLEAQECAGFCRPIWRDYIDSLVALAETGEGHPWRPGVVLPDPA